MKNNLKILDLKEKSLKINSDFCIIGAGAIGIYTAIQLSKKKIKVSLVEAGDNNLFYDSYSLGFGAKFSSNIYNGAISGRYYGLGGSTSRWAGLLTPYCSYDLPNENNIHFKTWSHIIKKIKFHQKNVLNSLMSSNLNFDSYFDNNNNLDQPSLKDYDNLVLPFSKRNLSSLFKNNYKYNQYITIYTNSIVNKWCNNIDRNNSSIKKIIATSINGNTLEIISKKFIICAGTLESTRMLLEIKDQMPENFIQNDSFIGKYLSDHLSTKIGVVRSDNYKNIADEYGIRFIDKWIVRKKILELSRDKSIPRFFMHYTINYNIEIVKYLREFFQLIQRNKIPIFSVGKLAQISELYKVVYNRFIYKKLYVNSDSPINFQLDFEQSPNIDNSLNLLNRRDTYDRKILNIDWKIKNEDLENFYKIYHYILKKFPNLNKIIDFINFDSLQNIKFDDAYHPVGTCIMGDNYESVIDLDLKVKGIDNLWSINLGVFPSAGSANPTFSLLCLAHDFSKNIV
jgi:hypothetical protein